MLDNHVVTWYNSSIKLDKQENERWHVNVAIHEDVQASCMLDDLGVDNYHIVYSYLKGLQS